ncbi:hypothetical protein D3C76_1385310 [compost metagenome]
MTKTNPIMLGSLLRPTRKTPVPNVKSKAIQVDEDPLSPPVFCTFNFLKAGKLSNAETTSTGKIPQKTKRQDH